VGLFGTKVISNWLCFKSSNFLFPQWALPWQPILGKIGNMTFIPQAGILKRLAIWLFLFGNIVATLCASLVKIGPVTPEFAWVRTARFWTRWQKSACPCEYLGNY